MFSRHRAEFGSFFAYHGSPEHNFHSIIHRGLRCSLNVRDAYGPGTYLSSDLETAKLYSGRSKHYYSDEYPNSTDSCCIAIVEVIKHPSIEVVDSRIGMKTLNDAKFDDTSSSHLRYYVVNSDDLMRLKHLLVFN